MSRPQPVPYTAAEAAPLLRVNAWTVRELCRTGALKAHRPGKVWLIDPDDLEAYKKMWLIDPDDLEAYKKSSRNDEDAV